LQYRVQKPPTTQTCSSFILRSSIILVELLLLHNTNITPKLPFQCQTLHNKFLTYRQAVIARINNPSSHASKKWNNSANLHYGTSSQASFLTLIQFARLFPDCNVTRRTPRYKKLTAHTRNSSISRYKEFQVQKPEFNLLAHLSGVEWILKCS